MITKVTHYSLGPKGRFDFPLQITQSHVLKSQSFFIQDL